MCTNEFPLFVLFIYPLMRSLNVSLNVSFTFFCWFLLFVLLVSALVQVLCPSEFSRSVSQVWVLVNGYVLYTM